MLKVTLMQRSLQFLEKDAFNADEPFKGRDGGALLAYVLVRVCRDLFDN